MASSHQQDGDGWQDFAGVCLPLLHDGRTTFNLSFALLFPCRDNFIALVFSDFSHIQHTSHKGIMRRLRSYAGGPCLIRACFASTSGNHGLTVWVIHLFSLHTKTNLALRSCSIHWLAVIVVIVSLSRTILPWVQGLYLFACFLAFFLGWIFIIKDYEK